MAIIVASMVVIVFAAVGVLAFVTTTHLMSTSTRFRAQLRRLIFAGAAQLCVARRAAAYKLAPVVARVAERLRSRSASAAPVAELESAGQQ